MQDLGESTGRNVIQKPVADEPNTGSGFGLLLL